MPFAEELADLAVKHNPARFSGAWYGHAGTLAPGVGVIFDGIAYPLFNPSTQRYQVQSGLVLILTHECDIDQNNSRAMNRGFLLVPLIPLAMFAAHFSNEGLEDDARALARDIAANKVHRLMFLLPPNELLRVANFPLGAFLYFNAITNADISHLSADGARPVCALSEVGLQALDARLKNHLFRPKAEQLPRTI
jgi:hypothetical protein